MVFVMPTFLPYQLVVPLPIYGTVFLEQSATLTIIKRLDAVTLWAALAKTSIENARITDTKMYRQMF